MAVGVASLLTSGIACADTLFISNNGSNSIEEITGGVASTDFSGGVTSTFISPTTQLNGPTGVAVYDGNLYVANNGSGAGTGFVAEFSITTHAFLGDYVTGLSNPRGITFDGAGNLYVANQSSGTIVEIPTGSPLLSTGFALAGGVSFNTPNGIAFSGGDLYVASAGTNMIDQISSFSSSAATIVTFGTGLNNPNGIAFKGTTLFVMDTGNNEIKYFTSAGTGANTGASSANMNNSKGLAVDSLGDIYVTDEGSNQVTEYNSSGGLVAVFSSGFNGPNYITVMPSISVPEPSIYALLTVGLGLLFFMSRRKTATA